MAVRLSLNVAIRVMAWGEGADIHAGSNATIGANAVAAHAAAETATAVDTLSREGRGIWGSNVLNIKDGIGVVEWSWVSWTFDCGGAGGGGARADVACVLLVEFRGEGCEGCEGCERVKR